MEWVSGWVWVESGLSDREWQCAMLELYSTAMNEEQCWCGVWLWFGYWYGLDSNENSDSKECMCTSRRIVQVAVAVATDRTEIDWTGVDRSDCNRLLISEWFDWIRFDWTGMWLSACTVEYRAEMCNVQITMWYWYLLSKGVQGLELTETSE